MVDHERLERRRRRRQRRRRRRRQRTRSVRPGGTRRSRVTAADALRPAAGTTRRAGGWLRRPHDRVATIIKPFASAAGQNLGARYNKRRVSAGVGELPVGQQKHCAPLNSVRVGFFGGHGRHKRGPHNDSTTP